MASYSRRPPGPRGDPLGLGCRSFVFGPASGKGLPGAGWTCLPPPAPTSLVGPLRSPRTLLSPGAQWGRGCPRARAAGLLLTLCSHHQVTQAALRLPSLDQTPGEKTEDSLAEAPREWKGGEMGKEREKYQCERDTSTDCLLHASQTGMGREPATQF